MDYLVPEQGPNPPPTCAVVVPPPGGKLLAVDAGKFEAWWKAFSSYQEGQPHPVLPAGTVMDKPDVLCLSHASRGRALRLQAQLGTPPGSMYRVAFVTGQPDGMAGGIDLVKTLVAEGREKDADAVLQRVMDAFPRSPQLAELKALRGKDDKAGAAATPAPP